MVLRGMLISLSKRFIFIATLKAASTAIEERLRPYAEIALTESRFGKHDSIYQILQKFHWIFREVPLQDFFVFGVMRNPVSLMLSLYNSHGDEKFSDNESLYTGNMSFSEFLERWVPEHHGQARQQYIKYIDDGGLLMANLVISYDKIIDGLVFASDFLSIPELRDIPFVNQSPKLLGPESLSQSEIKWVDEHFSGDYFLLNRWSNRYRDHGERVIIEYGAYSENYIKFLERRRQREQRAQDT